MAQAANRQKLFEQMNEYMKNDRAKHTILPITKFGLMQITRQRVRPATRIETEEVCPTCKGKGQVQPTVFFTDEVEEMVRKLTKEEGIKKFTLHLHPYVAAYLTKKKASSQGLSFRRGAPSMAKVLISSRMSHWACWSMSFMTQIKTNSLIC